MIRTLTKSCIVCITILTYCLATSVFFHAIGMDKVSGNQEGGCHPIALDTVSFDTSTTNNQVNSHQENYTHDQQTNSVSAGSDSTHTSTQSNNYKCFDDCFSDYAHTALAQKISYKKITVDDLPCIDLLHHGYGREEGSERIGLDSKYQVTEGTNDQIFIQAYIGTIKQVE